MYALQAGRNRKRIKLDMVPPSFDIRTINSWLPKIENLEYFPPEILLQIFTTVDDFGLLNLSENRQRFESIARIVFNKRYTHEYFPVSAVNPIVTYGKLCQIFQIFSNEIKAIEIEGGHLEDGRRSWIERVLNSMDNLGKLKLHIRVLDSNEHLNLLQQHARSSITHLTIRNQVRKIDNGFVLSKFNNLKQLELIDNP